MPDYLLNLDRHLFYLVNHDLANSFFDWLMPLLRNPKFWIPLYVLIAGYCFWKYKRLGLMIIIFLAMSAGIADFTSATIFKSIYQRLRPCRDPVTEQTDIIRVGCGTGYSFPSTHATDHFAMAIFISLVFSKKWRWIWLWAVFWAASICFAQVYVGVHYPIDVITGALYGSLVGWLMYLLFKILKRKYFSNSEGPGMHNVTPLD